MSILETKSLSKNFGGLQAVYNVTIELSEGEILGLIGPNGSGKTTFINLVNGIIKPTAGEILFLGEEITGLPPHVLTRKGISRTFQHNTLFKHLSVWDNVLIAHELLYKQSPWRSLFSISESKKEEKEIEESVLAILREMNLLAWRDKLCSDLPHGIQRMVQLAIALALKPMLMLLDEPFTGLNMSEIAKMVELIAKMRESGVAILLVEHRVKVVMDMCDRIVVLNFGELIAEGPPEEVRENEKVIKGYLGDGEYDFRGSRH